MQICKAISHTSCHWTQLWPRYYMALKIVAKRSMLVILCYQPQLRAWAIVVLLYCNKFKNIFMFQVASCKDIFFTDPSSLVGHWENFNSNYIFKIICFPYCAKLSLWNDFHKLNGSEAQLWGWWRDWVEKFFFQDTGRKWCFVAAIHKKPNYQDNCYYKNWSH